MVYQEIMGKPYLIQYQYAAEQIQRLSSNGKPINKFYIIGDNPEVDIKGANVFLEHLNTQKTHHNHHYGCNHKEKQPVESILVCTGVYNPQNDLLFHVRKLFEQKNAERGAQQVSSDNENDRFMADENDDDRLIEQPREEKEELDENELSQALSNQNSFISYFDDKLNIPDHTFDNLRHSVDFILRQSDI